jgi:hypothetical protein
MGQGRQSFSVGFAGDQRFDHPAIGQANIKALTAHAKQAASIRRLRGRMASDSRS